MDFTKFSPTLLFVVTLISAVLATFLIAFFIKKKSKNPSDIYVFNAISIIISAFILLALNGFEFKVSSFSFWLAIAFGVATMGNTLFDGFAVKKGPWSFTTIIHNFSTAITALSGWLFWNESISVLKFLGIAFILLCFVLTAKTDKKENKKANLSWFILCLLAMLSSAAVGLLQKIHQGSSYKDELMSFLIVAFIFDAIASLIVFFIKRRKEKLLRESVEFENGSTVTSEKKENIFTWVFFVFVLIVGGGSALNNCLNLYLCGVIPTAIFFPIANGVPLLSAVVLSFLVFKERLSKNQKIGLLVGLVAIALLLIPV